MSRKSLSSRHHGLLIAGIGAASLVLYMASIASGYIGLEPSTMPRHVIVALSALLLGLFCCSWYCLFAWTLFWTARRWPAGERAPRRELAKSAARSTWLTVLALVALGAAYTSGFMAFSGDLDAAVHRLVSWVSLVVAVAAMGMLVQQFRRIQTLSRVR